MDSIVECFPERRDECSAGLGDPESVPSGESRQVFDVPERAPSVIEHVATLQRCECGQVSCGAFPTGALPPTQYGPGFVRVGVYLHVFRHLPFDRACQALADMVGANVSSGTLTGLATGAPAGLRDFDQRVRGLLAGAPVCHFDETGGRIAGRLG